MASDDRPWRWFIPRRRWLRVVTITPVLIGLVLPAYLIAGIGLGLFDGILQWGRELREVWR